MHKIIFPLKLQMKRPEVAHLHEVLILLGSQIPEAERATQRFGASTRAAVRQFQAAQQLAVTGVVDEATAARLNSLLSELGTVDGGTPRPSDGPPAPPPTTPAAVVRGRLMRADGQPVARITIRAFDKELRSEKLLGATITSDVGAYAITYTHNQLSRPDKTRADLIVRAFGDDGREVAASAPIIDVPAEQSVDLVYGNELYRGPAEYTRVRDTLAPYLGQADPAGLTADEIAYLAAKTGLDAAQITHLATAERLARQFSLPPAACYGLLRKGMPADRTALLRSDWRAVQRSLQAALDENIIPREAVDVAQVTASFQQAVVAQAFDPPATPGTSPLGDLLTTTLLSRPQQESLLLGAVQHEGSRAEFWAGLRADPAFGEAVVTDVQFSLQLGQITGNYIPLVQHLQEQRRSGVVASARDLARLDVPAWRGVLNTRQNGQFIGAPPDTPGETESERINTYTAILADTFEKLYPTAALAGRLARAAKPAQAELVHFLDNNPLFDLGVTPIATFLPGSNLGGITNDAQLTADLKSMQRVYRLAPAEHRLNGMTALLDAGLHSAQSIKRLGRDRFVHAFAASVGGASVATQIYNNASQTAAAALALYTKYSPSTWQASPWVLGSWPSGSEVIPDWATLFGSLDYCACEHCRSVYSPAAYLVDVLHFLGQYETVGPIPPAAVSPPTVLDKLLQRRPDLGEIELTCVNTNTLMPYLDLALEVFENAVAGELVAYQTSWTTAELNANAEHINPVAYDGEHLAGQVHPFAMPFHLWLTEARTFLEHLGVSLYQLLEAFQREPASADDPNDDTWQETVRRAGEYLRLTPLARRVITGDAEKSLADLWGLTGDLVAQLSDVPTSLAQAGMSYDQLLELLSSRFINPIRGPIGPTPPDVDPFNPTPRLPGPDQPPGLEPPAPGSRIEVPLQVELTITFSTPCTLEGATLNRLNESHLDRIHRFLRLQQPLGWTIRDLDRVLTAVGDGALDAVFLVRLMHVKQLLEKFGLPLSELVSWWANIKTTVYPQDEEQRSLYERLFSNNAVLNPVDPAFALNEDQTELATIGLMSEHIPTIIAALEISAEEYELIMVAQVTDNTLNLANLSHLYRIVSLARALGLSVSEFLSVSALTGIDPFDRTQISQTLKFVECVEQIQASASSIAELDYLLRHVYDPAAGIGLSQEAIRTALATLSAGLTQIAQDHAFVADPTDAITASKLALLLPVGALPEALKIIAGASHLNADQQTRFIKTNFEPFLDPAEAVVQLVVPPGTVEPEDLPARYAYVLGAALSYLARVASQAFVTRQFATDSTLELAVAQALLTIHLPHTLASLQALVGTVDSTVYEAAYQAYLLLHKIVLALTKLGAGLTDLPWLFNPQDASGQEYAFGWYDLRQLPLTPQDALDEETYRSWARLVSVFAFRERFPTSELSVFDVLATGHSSASADPVRDMVAAYTGWKRDDIVTLAGLDAFGFVFPDDYQDERYLLRLDRAFTLLDLIGMPAEAVITWVPSDDTDTMQTMAQSIKQAVKAKYDEATWLTIAPPLKDALREQQRAALVTYLVATMAKIDQPSDLFEHFLIDGEMGACMDTSRIKQAISSVQLFVQRCLMGLEPDVQLPAEAAVQWEWMKQYRGWEAARKIFLYPENWIEPDLRDDKSPFFEALSSELLQSELTNESAETALRHYLEQLDQVDRLEVRSLYHQLETADDGTPIDILHVIARSHNAPHVHYYRQRIDDAYWTPWEQVNVSVAGSHEFLVVYQGWLYLFMPELELNEDGLSFRVTLEWSKYQHGQWTSSQKSEQILSTRAADEEDYFFKTEPDGDDLLIVVVEYGVVGREVVEGFYRAFRMHSDEKVEVDNQNQIYMIEVPPGTQGKYMAVAEIIQSEPADGTPRPPSPLELSWSDAAIGEVVEYSPRDEVEVLGNTPGLFELVLPHQYGYFAVQDDFFYHGMTRVFYVHPTWVRPELELPEERLFTALEPVASRSHRRVGTAGTRFTRSSTNASSRLEGPLNQEKKLKFATFHHAFVSDFVRRLNQGSVPALFRRATQRQTIKYFEAIYDPNTDVVSTAYPIDEVEFTYGGAYTIYNEELFFHAPLLIADSLRQNQRFAEAQRWYHYIFNPLDGADGNDIGPERYWNYYPFYQETVGDTTLDMMLDLAEGDRAVAKQVEQWRKAPFQPHALARLRPQAYQKTVVMKYILNLLGWGDQLFAQDTIETINEATQLYILAANILGDKPKLLPPAETAPKTFNALQGDLDAFANALVELEPYVGEPVGATGSDSGQLPTLTLYFGIPPNDNLLALWDTVADRLFKIRHCMNIEGVVRQLPLFEPPIDPGLLVQAAAMGIDLSSVLTGLYTPRPHYRFQVILQKAIELCNDVRALGAALLSALEKEDAEALSLLRAGQEQQLFESIKQTREKQVEEANEALEGLSKTREVSDVRLIYYQQLLSRGLNPQESLNLRHLTLGHALESKAGEYELRAARNYRIPDVSLSFKVIPIFPYVIPEPGFGTSYGGSFLGNNARARAANLQNVASNESFQANLASITGGYDRRQQEWQHQVDLATKEMEQIDTQIAAATIRVAIAELERDHTHKQIEHAREVYDVMNTKYTNQDLYSWMVSQISSIYFLSYQLAYDLAKRAEKAYQQEMALTDESSFIQFGYWDSLKKGLLAGEKLAVDLRRMETAYFEENKREYEITKHVSLALLDPIALLLLKQTGACFFNLPEEVFDLDYSNHYMRRIKSISLTIPCITGPYTSVSGTLTLLSNRIRREPRVDGGYAYTDLEDTRFQHNVGAIQSIAASSGQNDSGLFEFNFRDERYLPFEGAGVISDWKLELPKTFQQFDYNTISDVILHVRYTARDGGATLQEAVEQELTDALNVMVLDETEFGLDRLFSLRREFPNEWQRLLYPPGASDVQAVTLPLVAERFPFAFQSKDITIDRIEIFIKVTPAFRDTVTASRLKVLLEPGTTASNTALDLGVDPSNGLLRAETSPARPPGDWTLALWQVPGDSAGRQRVAPEALGDVMLVCHYSVSEGADRVPREG